MGAGIKPEILCHQNIPKPLHGISPRTIMGKEAWDIERQKIYLSTGYKCAACGVHKSQAKKHQWLEAHEYYKIDYAKGTCEIIAIYPLCHYCHSFIHSGRLKMIMGKEKTKEEVKEILEHGLKILSENKLDCFFPTIVFAMDLGCETFGVDSYCIGNSGIEWNKWRLIYNGKEYKSKFNSFFELREYYER